ncbi:hypothetical protein [Methylorubrum rhodesianum]|uniref:hypothetical protein n=1 Tax=Methylorubrum rhodesianum TaxID=29427 RepID=UPI003744CEA3
MDRPIIFSAPMIRAIRREITAPGTGKTQTRRILTKLSGFGAVTEFGPSDTRGYDWHFRDRRRLWNDLRDAEMRKCLPYAVGDRLWVKENHYRTDDGDEEFAVYACDEAAVREHLAALDALPDSFPADTKARHRKLRPSIHMPRWASRLTLLVTDVRVERLNAISHADALAEGVEIESADPPFYYVSEISPCSLTAVGVEEPGGRHAERSFGKLWEHINGAGSWDANPWVVAVSFQPFETNIDRMPERQAVPVPAAAE